MTVGADRDRGQTSVDLLQTSEEWAEYGYDNGNTGHASANVGPQTSVAEQWSVPSPDLTSSPTVESGMVYVGTIKGVIAIDAGLRRSNGSTTFSTKYRRSRRW